MFYKNILSLVVTCLILSTRVSAQLSIRQVKDTLYAITTTNSVSDVLWNSKPDSWRSALPLSLKAGEQSVVLITAHPILKASAKGHPDVYESPRAIQLTGAVNFRDLGGYFTHDHRQVRWGKIYRSADISKLTGKDLRVIAQLNLKIVCDLRGPAEVTAAPDKLPNGVEDINLPAGSENIGAPGSFMKHLKTPQSADSMMRSVYERNDFFKAKYKPMFDQLLALEDDKALMFHCTAGKDRTGIGAALILYALGVEEPIILKDYEATNEYRKSGNEAMIASLSKQGIPEQAARSMMAADPAWLKLCFESLTKKYGSVDNFLTSEMELTPQKRGILKQKFLYPSNER